MTIASVAAGATIDPTTFGNAVVDAINDIEAGWAYAQATASPGWASGGPVDLVTLSASLPAGTYRIDFGIDGGTTVSVADSEIYCNLTDLSNTVLRQTRVFNTTVYSKSMPSMRGTHVMTHAGGTLAVKLRLTAASGDGQVIGNAAYPQWIAARRVTA